MKQTVLKYGLIGAGIMAALILFIFLLNSGQPNFEWGQVIGYASMIIALSTVYMGIKSYRDRQQAGILSFSRAFTVGILISLFACVVYVIIWLIYLQTDAGSEMMDQYMAYSLDQMEKSGADAASIEEKRQQFEQYSKMYENPVVRIGVTFMEIFPVGLIIALVSALLLRRGQA